MNRALHLLFAIPLVVIVQAACGGKVVFEEDGDGAGANGSGASGSGNNGPGVDDACAQFCALTSACDTPGNCNSQCVLAEQLASAMDCEQPMVALFTCFASQPDVCSPALDACSGETQAFATCAALFCLDNPDDINCGGGFGDDDGFDDGF